MYAARITTDPNGGFLAYVVRIDRDGEEQVSSRIRHYTSRAHAQRATARILAEVLA
jgi:hypothetical protein